MKQNRETIRNPKNWNNPTPEDNSPWDEIAEDADKYSNVEYIDDIREYERNHYFPPQELYGLSLANEYDNDIYYQEYENWAEHQADRVETIAIPPDIIERYPIISELPNGVCIMGGMARSIAREIITGDIEPIRDIDLVNILDENGKSRVDTSTLDYLSHKYMPDDYAFGHGIADSELDDYFKTRDFTINQCLVQNNNLLLTYQAYNDFQENIIRPTSYELPDRDWVLSSRLSMKALMMRVVLENITDSIPLLEDVNIDTFYIRPFDVALTLNKMMSRGAEMANAFTAELADWNIIPDSLSDKPMQTASILLGNVYNFEFRPVSPDEIDEQSKDLKGFFSEDIYDHYHARDPKIADLIEEYDNMTAEDFSNGYNPDYLGNERVRGKYTLQDYQQINNYSQ